MTGCCMVVDQIPGVVLPGMTVNMSSPRLGVAEGERSERNAGDPQLQNPHCHPRDAAKRRVRSEALNL
jgi:hypothetical protein